MHNKKDVLTDTLVRSQDQDIKSMNFNDIMYLAYTKEKEGKEYAKDKLYSVKRPKEYTDYQISLIRQLGGGVKFYKNGGIFNPMSMMYEGFWAYKKVGDLLPMDYK